MAIVDALLVKEQLLVLCKLTFQEIDCLILIVDDSEMLLAHFPQPVFVALTHDLMLFLEQDYFVL